MNFPIQYTVSFDKVNYTGPIEISLSGTPSNLDVTPSLPTIISGNSQVYTFSITSGQSVTPGTYSLDWSAVATDSPNPVIDPVTTTLVITESGNASWILNTINLGSSVVNPDSLYLYSVVGSTYTLLRGYTNGVDFSLYQDLIDYTDLVVGLATPIKILWTAQVSILYADEEYVLTLPTISNTPSGSVTRTVIDVNDSLNSNKVFTQGETLDAATADVSIVSTIAPNVNNPDPYNPLAYLLRSDSGRVNVTAQGIGSYTIRLRDRISLDPKSAEFYYFGAAAGDSVEIYDGATLLGTYAGDTTVAMTAPLTNIAELNIVVTTTSNTTYYMFALDYSAYNSRPLIVPDFYATTTSGAHGEVVDTSSSRSFTISTPSSNPLTVSFSLLDLRTIGGETCILQVYDEGTFVDPAKLVATYTGLVTTPFNLVLNSGMATLLLLVPATQFDAPGYNLTWTQ